MTNPSADGIYELRRAVKHLLVDKGLDRKGSQLKLSRQLTINHSSLNSALTGYLNAPSSYRILETLHAYLSGLPDCQQDHRRTA
jgi:hypothetical protein